jgi:hypothetical protein
VILADLSIFFPKRLLNPVPVSLDQTSDSEPATGHQFFCLKHDFAISKYFNPFLTPHEGQNNILNGLNCTTLAVGH